MDDFLDTLNDNYLVSQFEAAINNGGDRAENDLIFNNPAAMLFLAEHEYKKIHAKDIMNRPSHVCSKENGCKMLLKIVTAYRKTTWIGNSSFQGFEQPPPCNDNLFTSIFGTGANPANYQICFGAEECEHTKLGHYCEYTQELKIPCHHTNRYDQSNIKRLGNFWVCQDSGNVHACGSLCQQNKIVSETECDYVCSLTGVITSRNIVNDAPFSSASRLLPNDADATNGNLASDTAAGSTHKRKRSGVQFLDEASFEESLKWWENETETARNEAIVERVVDELFFSKKRQMLEADTYLAQYKEAVEEVSKYMRTKKQQHQQQETEQKTVNMIMGLCIFQYKVPTSIYFKNVPVMPAVRKYILTGLSKLDHTFIANNGVDISSYDTEYAGTGRDYKKINKLIFQTLKRRRDRDLGIDDEQTYNYDQDEEMMEIEREYEDKTLQRWMDKVSVVKKMFTVATTRLWENFNRNLHEMREFEKMFKFKNIVIPLLYMLRKQFSITENTASSNNLNSVQKVYKPFSSEVEQYTEFHFSEEFTKADKMRVIVIPKVEFALLLPHDNQLHKFDLNSDMTSENLFYDYYSDAQKFHKAQKQKVQKHDQKVKTKTEKLQKHTP